MYRTAASSVAGNLGIPTRWIRVQISTRFGLSGQGDIRQQALVSSLDYPLVGRCQCPGSCLRALLSVGINAAEVCQPPCKRLRAAAAPGSHAYSSSSHPKCRSARRKRRCLPRASAWPQHFTSYTSNHAHASLSAALSPRKRAVQRALAQASLSSCI